MIFILTLLVFSGGSVALTTAEYSNVTACEAAKGEAVKTFVVNTTTRVVGTCTKK